jgi:hypothetical protein
MVDVVISRFERTSSRSEWLLAVSRDVTDAQVSSGARAPRETLFDYAGGV